MCIGNCMVAQSGGPTSAINASLAGVIAGAKASGEYAICYGAVNGILGILNQNYLNLNEKIPDDETLKKLTTTPAMYLGSCRHKLPTIRMMILHTYLSFISSPNYISRPFSISVEMIPWTPYLSYRNMRKKSRVIFVLSAFRRLLITIFA